jgi:hypothetical protein
MQIRELLASTAGSGNLDFFVCGHLDGGEKLACLLERRKELKERL